MASIANFAAVFSIILLHRVMVSSARTLSFLSPADVLALERFNFNPIKDTQSQSNNDAIASQGGSNMPNDPTISTSGGSDIFSRDRTPTQSQADHQAPAGTSNFHPSTQNDAQVPEKAPSMTSDPLETSYQIDAVPVDQGASPLESHQTASNSAKSASTQQQLSSQNRETQNINQRPYEFQGSILYQKQPALTVEDTQHGFLPQGLTGGVQTVLVPGPENMQDQPGATPSGPNPVNNGNLQSKSPLSQTRTGSTDNVPPDVVSTNPRQDNFPQQQSASFGSSTKGENLNPDNSVSQEFSQIVSVDMVHSPNQATSQSASPVSRQSSHSGQTGINQDRSPSTSHDIRQSSHDIIHDSPQDSRHTVSHDTRQTMDSGQAISQDNRQDTRQTISQDTRQTIPHDNRQTIPQDTRQTNFQDTRQTIPQDTRQTLPQDTRQTIRQDTRQTVPQGTRNLIPQDNRQTLPQNNERHLSQDFRQPVVQGNRQTIPQNNRQSVPQNTRQTTFHDTRQTMRHNLRDISHSDTRQTMAQDIRHSQAEDQRQTAFHDTRSRDPTGTRRDVQPSRQNQRESIYEPRSTSHLQDTRQDSRSSNLRNMDPRESEYHSGMSNVRRTRQRVYEDPIQANSMDHSKLSDPNRMEQPLKKSFYQRDSVTGRNMHGDTSHDYSGRRSLGDNTRRDYRQDSFQRERTVLRSEMEHNRRTNGNSQQSRPGQSSDFGSRSYDTFDNQDLRYRTQDRSRQFDNSPQGRPQMARHETRHQRHVNSRASQIGSHDVGTDGPLRLDASPQIRPKDTFYHAIENEPVGPKEPTGAELRLIPARKGVSVSAPPVISTADTLKNISAIFGQQVDALKQFFNEKLHDMGRGLTTLSLSVLETTSRMDELSQIQKEQQKQIEKSQNSSDFQVIQQELRSLSQALKDTNAKMTELARQRQEARPRAIVNPQLQLKDAPAQTSTVKQASQTKTQTPAPMVKPIPEIPKQTTKPSTRAVTTSTAPRHQNANPPPRLRELLHSKSTSNSRVARPHQRVVGTPSHQTPRPPTTNEQKSRPSYQNPRIPNAQAQPRRQTVAKSPPQRSNHPRHYAQLSPSVRTSPPSQGSQRGNPRSSDAHQYNTRYAQRSRPVQSPISRYMRPETSKTSTHHSANTAPRQHKAAPRSDQRTRPQGLMEKMKQSSTSHAQNYHQPHPHSQQFSSGLSPSTSSGKASQVSGSHLLQLPDLSKSLAGIPGFGSLATHGSSKQEVESRGPGNNPLSSVLPNQGAFSSLLPQGSFGHLSLGGFPNIGGQLPGLPNLGSSSPPEKEVKKSSQGQGGFGSIMQGQPALETMMGGSFASMMQGQQAMGQQTMGQQTIGQQAMGQQAMMSAQRSLAQMLQSSTQMSDPKTKAALNSMVYQQVMRLLGPNATNISPQDAERVAEYLSELSTAG